MPEYARLSHRSDRVTFSLYRTYGIQSEQKYLIRTHTREHRTIVSRI